MNMQKCVAPRVCRSYEEKEEGEWVGAGESPAGRIQQGRRQHGKGSMYTLRTWPTANSSLADLSWHSTPVHRPHKLSLVEALQGFWAETSSFRLMHVNRALPPTLDIVRQERTLMTCRYQKAAARTDTLDVTLNTNTNLTLAILTERVSHISETMRTLVLMSINTDKWCHAQSGKKNTLKPLKKHTHTHSSVNPLNYFLIHLKKKSVRVFKSDCR